MTKQEKELFDKNLESYGFCVEDLTEDESEQLLEEVRATLRGEIVLDTILMSKPMYSLKKK